MSTLKKNEYFFGNALNKIFHTLPNHIPNTLKPIQLHHGLIPNPSHSIDSIYRVAKFAFLWPDFLSFEIFKSVIMTVIEMYLMPF